MGDLWLDWNEEVVSDYTDLGGDVERDYVHRVETYYSYEVGFARFKALSEAGHTVTMIN